MRLYHAICELIEAYAARTRTETFENEMDNVDWARAQADDED